MFYPVYTSLGMCAIHMLALHAYVSCDFSWISAGLYVSGDEKSTPAYSTMSAKFSVLHVEEGSKCFVYSVC